MKLKRTTGDGQMRRWAEEEKKDRPAAATPQEVVLAENVKVLDDTKRRG